MAASSARSRQASRTCLKLTTCSLCVTAKPLPFVPKDHDDDALIPIEVPIDKDVDNAPFQELLKVLVGFEMALFERRLYSSQQRFLAMPDKFLFDSNKNSSPYDNQGSVIDGKRGDFVWGPLCLFTDTNNLLIFCRIVPSDGALMRTIFNSCRPIVHLVSVTKG